MLVLLTPAYSQTPSIPKSESSPPSAATEALASASKVEGLELPSDQVAANDEGFVTLQAKTKGTVKWLVVSAVKVKYVSIPDNSIIVSVPPQGGIITVFAVAIVDGKLTEFARTNITIIGVPPVPIPNPNPNPNPKPNPGGALHITLLVDASSLTADYAAILNSQTLRTAIAAKGNFFRYYDIKNPVVTEKKLDAIAQKTGSSFVVIVQRNDGVVIFSQTLPRTEQEISSLLQKVGGL